MTSWRHRAEAIREGVQSALSSLGRDTSSAAAPAARVPQPGGSPRTDEATEAVPAPADPASAGAPATDPASSDSGMTHPSAGEATADSRAVAGPAAAGPTVAKPSADAAAAAPTVPSPAAAAPFRMRGYRSEGGGERFGPQIDSSLAGLARSTPDPAAAQDAAAHPLTTEIFVGARSITRRELRELRARAEAAGEPVPEVRFGTGSPASAPSAAPAPSVPPTSSAPPTSSVPSTPSAPAVPVADAAGVVEEVIAPARPTGRDPILTADPAPADPEASDHVQHAEVQADPDLEPRPEPEPHRQAEPGASEEPIVTVDPAGVVGLSSPSEDAHVEAEHEPDAPLDAPGTVDDSLPVEPERHDDTERHDSELHHDSERHDEGPVPAPEAIEMPVIVEIDATPIAMIGVEDHSEHDVVVAELIESDATDTAGRSDTAGAPASDEVTLAAAGDRAVAVPVGHWSLQATDEDENDLHESVIRRDVAVTGGGPMTHALVLPSVPDQEEQLQTPIVATGEIVITGLIDVTRSADATASTLPDNGLALPEEPAPVFAEPEPVTAPSRAPLVVAIIGLALVLVVAGAFFVAAVVYDIF